MLIDPNELWHVLVLDANLTSAYPVSDVARLERLFLRLLELLVVLDGSQPEAEGVGEVVARALAAVALDEGRRPEVFQAGAGTGERLASPFRACCGMLQGRQIYCSRSMGYCYIARRVLCIDLHPNI